MSTTAIIVIVLFLAALNVVFLFFLYRKLGTASTEKEEGGGLAVISQQMGELNRTMDQKISESSKQLNESVRSQLSEIKNDVSQSLKSNRETIDLSSRTMQDRVKDFTQSITKMEGNLSNVFDSIKTSNEKMSSFQDIFKTPKLRGQWGETNLAYLLEQTYSHDRVKKQYYFKDGNPVDFVIKLPNDLLLPIDSKFPMEVFTAFAEETNPADKVRKKQTFVSSVKKEIDSISSKYIKPEESTTDFALLYTPAEAVYYEILFSMKDDDIVEYAQKKRVQLVSPNTLKLSLSVIEHWIRDITVNKDTREIVKRLNVILQDGKKLSESFAVLGKHISNVKGAFDDTGKRVELISSKIEKVITIGKESNSEPENILIEGPEKEE